MRQYRGKRVDGGGWVYGSLIVKNAYDLNDGVHKPEPEKMWIREQHVTWNTNPNDKCWMCYQYEVVPESVGQSTGKADKSGVDVYAWDIVALKSRYPAYQHTQAYGVIEWVESFYAYMIREFIVPAHPKGKILSQLNEYSSDCLEVIGNATDNPELLKEQDHEV